MRNKNAIIGKITDVAFNNEPLAFANVYIKGTSKGVTSDIDGIYALENIKPGTYTLIYSFVGYETVEIPNVEVNPKKVTHINVPMGQSAAALDAVVIKTTTRRTSESVLLLEQRKATQIKESIGADQLSKLGVSDAAGATTKISGISKTDGGGAVFVRGLGDRYLFTSLNGLPIPSDNIERKNINLNLFPTRLIESIDVSKTSSPNISADQASGNINISIIVIEKSQERKLRTEALEEKLDGYTEITHAALDSNIYLDSLLAIFPDKIRLTLIHEQGEVYYDNAIDDLSELENHLDRPEIIKAKSKGKGSNIRTSSSNNIEYLYYVKDFGDYFIRVALPYDVKVQQFIKTDNLFLYYIIALFLGMLILINLIATRFGNTIKQLRDFVVSSDDHIDGFNTSFPRDELGEISERIVANYKQLKSNKIKITQEREKLLQHVQSSKEGICFFSAEKKVQFYNGLFIQYLNLIVNNANSNPTNLFTDNTFEALNTFLTSSDDKNYFETQIEKHSRHFALRVNIFDDKSFEIILNDITKQKKTQLLKQEMTGNIAHELRTPVTSIRGYLETVLETPLDDDKKRQFLTKAFQQTLSLSELIRDMGLITKIEEAPDSFSLEPTNLTDVLENLRSDLAIPLSEKNITMHWSLPKKLMLTSNKNLLYSIFRNLTDNVISYAGTDVRISISRYNEDSGFYYILFADTGKGIADEQHFNRLFERFYRINEGRSRDSGGSGLGLAIVKNAVALHKGTVSVRNRQGGGLEFLIKLPKA